ncbi:hypothetical protein C0J52_00801 [Blattella germanica]|nr:hypothetical protein C0J52_00801 [Blattella germanica]
MFSVLAHCHWRADAHTQQLLGSALSTSQRQLCTELAVGMKLMAFWEGYIYGLSECKCSYHMIIKIANNLE